MSDLLPPPGELIASCTHLQPEGTPPNTTTPMSFKFVKFPERLKLSNGLISQWLVLCHDCCQTVEGTIPADVSGKVDLLLAKDLIPVWQPKDLN